MKKNKQTKSIKEYLNNKYKRQNLLYSYYNGKGIYYDGKRYYNEKEVDLYYPILEYYRYSLENPDKRNIL